MKILCYITKHFLSLLTLSAVVNISFGNSMSHEHPCHNSQTVSTHKHIARTLFLPPIRRRQRAVEYTSEFIRSKF